MRFDIFCKVVDNFGDAAVCWRLASQLASEHHAAVRLWIDEPATLCALRPGMRAGTQRQWLDQVEVLHWTAESAPRDPGDVVIEGFGCGIPEDLLSAMGRRVPASLWVVLEYLSAESWVEECHGLASPHPRFDIPRFYFFPGFTRRTGGLLRERDLLSRRDHFRQDQEGRSRLWKEPGFAPPPDEAIAVSLFGYDNPRVGSLCDAWATGRRDVVVAVPPGPLREGVCRYFGNAGGRDGTVQRRGRFEARFIPFLSQDRYDELLWSCDWNFVRGEDSFVRAQWAAQPMVWHIYPQQEDAHRAKLDAFLDDYTRGVEPPLAEALSGFWRGWNGLEAFRPETWETLQSGFDAWRQHAARRASELAARPDLASELANFCLERLK